MGKKEELEQLDMGLQEPISNRFKNLKYRTELFFIKVRTHSLFTAPFIWFSLIITTSLILVQHYYYANFIDKLPKEISLFSISSNPELKLVGKEFLLLILILSVVLTFFSVIISLKTFYKAKFIAILIMTNLVLSVFLITVSYIKIFGIYIF
jgi:hypothetical protein